MIHPSSERREESIMRPRASCLASLTLEARETLRDAQGNRNLDTVLFVQPADQRMINDTLKLTCCTCSSVTTANAGCGAVRSTNSI
jgi:hypothetical protein